MKIFLSHHSESAKSDVKRIVDLLPRHIHTWLDEEELIWGDDIELVLENVIKADVDYVMLFLNSKALSSDWIKREIKWASEKEKEVKRTIILPILLERDIWDDPLLKEYIPKTKQYIECYRKDDFFIQMTASYISNQLFKLVCKRLETLEEAAQNTTKKREDNIKQLLSRTESEQDRADFKLKLADEYFELAIQYETIADYKKADYFYTTAIELLTNNKGNNDG